MDISLFMLSISFANLLWIFSCKKEYHYPVCSKAFFNVDLCMLKKSLLCASEEDFLIIIEAFRLKKKTVLFVVPGRQMTVFVFELLTFHKVGIMSFFSFV